MVAPLFLLITATKFIGVVGLMSVAANLLSSHRRFNTTTTTNNNNNKKKQKKKKKKESSSSSSEKPMNEQLQQVLASFAIDKHVDEGGFFFGLATAPAHVEDQLDDAWIEFAKSTPAKKAENKGDDYEKPSNEGDPSLSSSSSSALLRETDQIVANPPPSETTEVENLVEAKQGSNPTFSDDWEVINDSQEKSLIDIGELLDKDSTSFPSAEEVLQQSGSIKVDESTDQSQFSRAKSTVDEPLLQFKLPNQGKKLAKIAMEAMIRGYQRFVEDDKTNVAAWHNVYKPEQRLKFWSDPDTEIKLAQATNVKVFRMGVDWTRIMPVEPLNGIQESVNWGAVHRYQDILKKVREHGMQVMLTLFHHSLPPWAGAYGGWKVEKTVDYFLEFVRIAVEKFSSLVDFWITFNEPHVFTMLTYCAGAWPGGDPNLLETVTLALPQGVYNRVMHMMAEAHVKAYDAIHKFCDEKDRIARVGVSHHVAFMRPYGLFDISTAMLIDKMTRYPYIDEICHKLDFIGINYYGQEVVSGPGLKLVKNDEYSESGRGVYPDGLYHILVTFHDRYKKYNLSYIITENGISDATDYIRRPYLIEHLLAVRAAIDNGVPVQGYCFWTTSDNWEWADGYGPKFGLVAVDREHDLKRIPRPSYFLFSEICKNGMVTKRQRIEAWAELQNAAEQGKKRPFCRAVNRNGLMYAGGLDVPVERPFVKRDWRFGEYEFDGLQDPISCLFRFLGRMVFGRHREHGNKVPLTRGSDHGSISSVADDFGYITELESESESESELLPKVLITA